MDLSKRNREMYDLYIGGMVQSELADKYNLSKGGVSLTLRKYARNNDLPMPDRGGQYRSQRAKDKPKSKQQEFTENVISELAQRPNAPIILSKPTDSFRAPSNGSQPQYNGLPYHKEREVRSIVGTIRKLEGDYLRMGIRSIRMSTGLSLNVHKYFRVGNVVSLDYYPGDNMLKSITLVREGGYSNEIST